MALLIGNRNKTSKNARLSPSRSRFSAQKWAFFSACDAAIGNICRVAMADARQSRGFALA
jgi:hypothetical protein